VAAVAVLINLKALVERAVSGVLAALTAVKVLELQQEALAQQIRVRAVAGQEIWLALLDLDTTAVQASLF
jgi:hypothetical protein